MVELSSTCPRLRLEEIYKYIIDGICAYAVVRPLGGWDVRTQRRSRQEDGTCAYAAAKPDGICAYAAVRPPGGWDMCIRSDEAARRMGYARTQRRSHQEDGICAYACVLTHARTHAC